MRRARSSLDLRTKRTQRGRDLALWAWFNYYPHLDKLLPGIARSCQRQRTQEQLAEAALKRTVLASLRA